MIIGFLGISAYVLALIVLCLVCTGLAVGLILQAIFHGIRSSFRAKLKAIPVPREPVLRCDMWGQLVEDPPARWNPKQIDEKLSQNYSMRMPTEAEIEQSADALARLLAGPMPIKIPDPPPGFETRRN